MRLTDISAYVDYLQEQEMTDSERWEHIVKRTEFGDKILELGMFLPCSEDGQILEKPEGYDNYESGGDFHLEGPDGQKLLKLWGEYKDAKSKVLFEGITIDDDDHTALCTDRKFGDLYIHFERQEDGTFEFHNYDHPVGFIDSLVWYELTLTESAIQQLKP